MTDTTPGCGSNSEARKRLTEPLTASTDDSVSTDAGSTPDDRDALADLHSPISIWEYEAGTFVVDEDDQRVLLKRLCRECSDSEAIQAVEDCEWQVDWYACEVEWPCRTVELLAEHDAQVRRETADQIAQAIEAQRIVCPIHRMTDCAPLLNGCSLVIRLHAQAEVDARIARQSVEGGGERG